MKDVSSIIRGNYGKEVNARVKGMMNGSIWGAALGIVTAVWAGKSLVLCTVGGAVAGGFIGRRLAGKKSTSNKSQTSKPTEQ